MVNATSINDSASELLAISRGIKQNLPLLTKLQVKAMILSENMYCQPLVLPNSVGYSLYDSGSGRKLEKLSEQFFIRPEAQALWNCNDQLNDWKDAKAEFIKGSDEEGLGRWQINDYPVKNKISYQNSALPSWQTNYFGLPPKLRLTPFRHYGFFPEQALLWQPIIDSITLLQAKKQTPKVLNLFAYSGMASLMARSMGAEVTHVDASKKAILYAEENIKKSWGVRLLIDDALGFVKREIRRGHCYDIILLDPPKFGRGPNGEEWDIWRDLPLLLQHIAQLLPRDRSVAVILTAYAIRASSIAMANALKENIEKNFIKQKINNSSIICGELCLIEQQRKILLPQAIYAIWRHQYLY